MLWAYMKPMEFKLARDDDEHPGEPGQRLTRVPPPSPAPEKSEVLSLREQVAVLQRRLDAIDMNRPATPTG